MADHDASPRRVVGVVEIDDAFESLIALFVLDRLGFDGGLGEERTEQRKNEEISNFHEILREISRRNEASNFGVDILCGADA